MSWVVGTAVGVQHGADLLDELGSAEPRQAGAAEQREASQCAIPEMPFISGIAQG